MKKLISVIIPCYNIAPYIGRCLESVLAQTYENLEILCVNDGSTDNTGKVLDEYAEKDARIKVIHKQNAGVTAARFSGLELAQGDWIGFVDGDDIIDADMYEHLLANVTDDTDISHCGYKKIFSNGDTEYYYNSEKKLLQNTLQGCKDLLEGAFIEPSLCNKLFRRHLFDGLREWHDCSIRINEDLLMNFYLFHHARQAVYEDFCAYTYLSRAGSASTGELNEYQLYDPLRVMEKIEEETKAEPELLSIVKNRIAYMLISGATREYGGKKDIVKPYRKMMLKRLRGSLGAILKDPDYTKKHKISAFWVCIWSASYRWAHTMYRSRKERKKNCKG